MKRFTTAIVFSVLATTAILTQAEVIEDQSISPQDFQQRFQIPYSYEQESSIYQLMHKGGSRYELEPTSGFSFSKVSSDLNLVISGLGIVNQDGTKHFNELSVSQYDIGSTLVYKSSKSQCNQYPMSEYEKNSSVKQLIDRMNDPYNDSDLHYKGLKAAFWSNENHLYHVFAKMSKYDNSKTGQEIFYTVDTGVIRFSVLYQGENSDYLFDFGEKYTPREFTKEDFTIKECEKTKSSFLNY
eukprot:403361086